MKILSLNLRGLGGNPTCRVVHHLLRSSKLDIIMIQETMSSGAKAIDYFSFMLSGWSFYAVDAVGLSRGLLLALNEYFVIYNSFCSMSSIILEGNFHGIGSPLKIVNCYGPYSNRKYFWEEMDLEGILSTKNLIIGRDLNLFTSAKDIWGLNNKPNPLAYFLNVLLTKAGIVDIVPNKLMPTWRNGRASDHRVAKHLDNFMVVESLLISFEYRSWVGTKVILDHQPI